MHFVWPGKSRFFPQRLRPKTIVILHLFNKWCREQILKFQVTCRRRISFFINPFFHSKRARVKVILETSILLCKFKLFWMRDISSSADYHFSSVWTSLKRHRVSIFSANLTFCGEYWLWAVCKLHLYICRIIVGGRSFHSDHLYRATFTVLGINALTRVAPVDCINL